MLCKLHTLALALAVLSLSPVASAHAQSDIPLAFRETAAFWDIPDPALLYAVALAESKRQLPNGALRPWPWTLNVAGKGYFYESETQAWAALYEFIAAGEHNIDIGLMQINYRWNEDTLIDPYTALDPAANLNMGAKILAAEYRASGDWDVAVGRYHSPGSSPAQRARAARYRDHVAALRRALLSETDR